MIINTEKIKALLFDENVSANSIEARTGVSKSTIAKIRRAEREFENLTLKTLMLLQTLIDNEEYRFIKPSTQLIEEVLDDIVMLGETFKVIAIYDDEEIKNDIIVDYCDFEKPLPEIEFEEDLVEYEKTLKEYEDNLAYAITKKHKIITLEQLLNDLEHQSKV